MIKRTLVISMMVWACMGMTACSSVQHISNKLTGEHQSAKQALEADHVQVIELGDYIRLIIPSTQLFVGSGAGFQTSAYKTLNQVAHYIAAKSKMTVRVVAYTYPQASAEVATKQTALQAQAVGRYLVRAGVDARFIYEQGGGFQQLISHNSSSYVQNYRVEITLKTLNPAMPG